VAGFCEHGNEPSGSIRKDIFDKLSDNHFLNNILHYGISKQANKQAL
jgi:hypothetical protein